MVSASLSVNAPPVPSSYEPIVTMYVRGRFVRFSTVTDALEPAESAAPVATQVVVVQSSRTRR